MSRKRRELPMTDYEIVCSYRQAKDQEAQIEILCDLNLCDRKVIEDILEVHGIELVKAKKTMDHRVIFHERINQLKGNTSANRLAQEIGVTFSSVKGWFDGTGAPDLDRLVKLAKYYNVSTDWLLGLSGTKDVPVNSASEERHSSKKSVLISINPRWCARIFGTREKTVEVRKNAPHIDGPFRCYVYQTKLKKAKNTNRGDGMIIGHFDCTEIAKWRDDYLQSSCLKADELFKYASSSALIIKDLFAWKIDSPVLYQEPKPLSDFSSFHSMEKIIRPPQSWCYVEELN